MINPDTTGDFDNSEQTDGRYNKEQNPPDGSDTFYKMAWNAFSPRINKLLRDNLDENKLVTQTLCNNLLVEVQKIKAENKVTVEKIASTNRIIKVIGTVLSAVISLFALIFTIFIFVVNSQYATVKDIINANLQSIQSEISAFDKKIEYIEKYNSIFIENEVQKQYKVIKK